MPYKLIVFCKILLKPILGSGKNVYNVFICSLNGLIIDQSQPNDWCIYINKGSVFLNGGGYLHKLLSKHNQDLFYIKNPNDRIYHRALKVGGDYIVFTTKKITLGSLNIPTSHLTDDTNQPIYANLNRYSMGVVSRLCEVQYGYNHNHSMVIQMFKQQMSTGLVKIIYHNNNGTKVVKGINYSDYINNTNSMYIKLIHEIVHTDL
jgi:hypothetical protein